MKKHFTGIALFVFIVGISGFVANLFVEVPKPEVFEITATVPQYTTKRKCSKKYRKSDNYSFSVKINRTVYDEKSGQIYIDYSIKRGNFKYGSVPVDLHFFIKAAKNTKYILTERTDFAPMAKEGFSYSGSERLFFPSLKNLSSHKNLYVIAKPHLEQTNGYLDGKKSIPVFDKDKATAVLIAED